MAFFNNIPRAEILQKANELSRKIGIMAMGQTFTGSCYGVYDHNGTQYKVRVADHIANPNNQTWLYAGTIDISPAPLPDMISSFERQLKALDAEYLTHKQRQAQQEADRAEKANRYAQIISDITKAGYRYFKNQRTYDNWADFMQKNPHAEYLVQLDAGNKAFQYEYLSKHNTEYGSTPSYEYLDKTKDDFSNEATEY